MVELTWCYGWSKWKAKDDTETVYFLWDVTGKLPFAMVASKQSDSPAQYINIYLPTFSQSNTWDFCLVMTRTSENITANITENVRRCCENHWEHLKLFRRRQFWCVSFSLEHKVIIQPLFGIFSGKLNQIFLINHVLRNNSSRFVSQVWQTILDAWHWCL